MQVIGFTFSKIAASRLSKPQKASANTNIDFISVENEKIEVIKEETVKIKFKFSVDYNAEEKDKKDEEPQIIIEGEIVISVTKKEGEEIAAAWKKTELPSSFKLPLFNLILKKCSIKALSLEEELGLPTHFPLPQVKAIKKKD